MKYQIEHSNLFRYETPVEQSLNHIRLKPLTDECQRLLSYYPEITPQSETKEHIDIWGNHVETFFIPEKHDTLEVKTSSVVSIQRSPFIHQLYFSHEMRNIFYSDSFHRHYLIYLNQTPATFIPPESYRQVLNEMGDTDNPILFALFLLEYIYRRFTFDTTASTVDTKASEALLTKRGVCQDFVHVMVGILRARWIPARYISGYLYVPEDSGLVGELSSHAWVEVMVPGIGWVGLDPTNNVEALQNHIRVGKGRDYFDVSPLRGVYSGGEHTLDVKVSVTAIE